MDLLEIWRYAQVALGIGMVIFVHEAGHFMAARLCKVRVETFSLGFGPRIFGWKRGPTMYQIAAVPFGGYVKMAGEDPTEDGPPRPDDLRAKSVGQRFFIYSGGVVMNVVFAAVVFPLILMAGVPFSEPVIGNATPGGPAWHLRVQPGTRVIEIDGAKTFSFESILNEVALGSPDGVELTVLEPGATEPRSISIRPEYRERGGFQAIDVEQGYDPERKLVVRPESPAAAAGLLEGDVLLGVEGALPDTQLPIQLLEGMQEGQAIGLRVERDGQERTVTVTPSPELSTGRAMLGVLPAAQRVRGIRDNADAVTLGLLEGDRLLSVDGELVARPSDLRRLLYEGGEREIQWVWLRDGAQHEAVLPALGAERALALADDIALEGDTDSTVAAISPESAAARAGMRNGDRFVRIANEQVDNWDQVLAQTRATAREGEVLPVAVSRLDGERQHIVELQLQPGPMTLFEYGFGLKPRTYIYKAETPLEAVQIGMRSTWKFTRDAWATLKRMLLGQVSSENLGGIIAISAVSYSWASVGIAKLLFFLCILSLNLAFLNVLPIPVLDGGHLFFLLIEKIKGSPVSERVLGYSQLVGLVMILSLMLYVTYNDIRRFLAP